MTEVWKQSAPKPDTKIPKNHQVEKNRGTYASNQGSVATLGVLGILIKRSVIQYKLYYCVHKYSN